MGGDLSTRVWCCVLFGKLFPKEFIGLSINSLYLASNEIIKYILDIDELNGLLSNIVSGFGIDQSERIKTARQNDNCTGLFQQ